MRRTLLLLAGTAASVLLLGLALDWGWIRLNYPDRQRFPIRGIDVSRHQGPIDWAKVAASGEADFAYIKATEGRDWVDPRFAENWAQARKHGVTAGAYHFFTLCRSGNEQALRFIATVPNEPGALPPVADLELGGNCQRRPTPAELHQEVEAWSAMVRAHFGREPIFYLTREMYELYFRDYPLSGRVWIRDVFREPAQRDPKWAIWQYANRGRVEGVEGPVDLNVFCCDRSAWERFR